MRLLMSLLICGFSISIAQAYDVENARRINKSCALCHGAYGQGTPGALSPRLAGLSTGYLVKEMKLYRDGTRKYEPMVMAAAIRDFSDKDIQDISEYLAEIKLAEMDLPEIPLYLGEAEKGGKIFKKECKSCHRSTGKGKPKKDIPMVSGQYGVYLFNQLKRFQIKDRHHDNDPEDDTFDDYDDQTLKSLAAYLTQLTNKQETERKQLAQSQHNQQLEALKAQIIAKKEAELVAELDSLKVTNSLVELEARLDAIAREEMLRISKKERMISMQAELANVCRDCSTEDDEYAGRFQITSRGEIILSPKHKDLRKLAGVSGNFKSAKDGGLEFIPDPQN